MAEDRFGGGPGFDLQQLGQLGQAAAQMPPGLLQMATDLVPQMYFGGGPQEEQAPTAGPAPAFNPGTTQGGYNAVFDPRAPSSTGGWFTMEDYNKGNTEGRGLTNQSRPGSGTHLSTNNWRLLPPGFQDPDYFMVDGSIVSRRAAQSALAPRSVLGVEGAEPPGYYFKGGGQWTRPFGSGGAMTGNIGSGDPWSIFSTPTY